MTRALVLLGALAASTTAAAATYSGKPAEPVTQTKLVGRDIIWNLAAGTYRGSTDHSRPLVLCQSLAKRAGRLDSFTVDGRAFAEAELAKCNAAAPQIAKPAFARAE